MKDIQLMDIDYSGKNISYKKEDTVDLSKISSPWIVPEEGPYYKDSLRVIKGGLDIDSDKFKAVSDVTDLTKLTGRGVCLYVELADDILASKGEVTVIYQKVGKPVISVKTLIQMLEDMVISGKPVDWDTQVANKPGSVWPAYHSHDIQNPNEMVGFGGLVELFTLFTNSQINDSAKVVEILERIQTEMYNRLDYIQKLKWGAIMDHVRNYNNPHGVVPADVDADKLSNYFLATPQQDGEADRTDLYSTPRGLSRIITETQPVTENFIVQAELPFGYYGSGIYLPPPITGSFEGLGGDQNNAVFNVEGNGWLVGLMRAYDGRVKNLYYIYNSDYQERNPAISPWLNSYVQYQHPTITAAGKRPNLVIDGSNTDILMLGDQPDPNDQITGTGNWWICASNSTFDSGSHNLKPVNMDEIKATCNTLAGAQARPGCYSVSKVGNWVYLLVTLNSFQGDDGANYGGTGSSAANWQTIMFRFPYSDLSDTTKTSITFTQVNVTYDTMWRERRSNKQQFIPQRNVFTDSSKKLVTEQLVKYNKPITNPYINRKKSWIIVSNPNNPDLAILKLLMSPYAFYTDPTNGGVRGVSSPGVMLTYNWDVKNNVLTLSSNYSTYTVDVDTSKPVNPTQAQIDYVFLDRFENNNIIPAISPFVTNFSNTIGSWIPGFGFISLYSNQNGGPPFYFLSNKFNRTGEIAQDYSSMLLPNLWKDGAGVLSDWRVLFKMRSPFGIAGFPRLYSDLYSTTTGIRTNPIELFVAENEDARPVTFYRVTEGGTDDDYAKRDSLQSPYINFPLYGRKTNSNFGTVSGLNMDIGYNNRPKRKNASSRGVGMFSWCRRAIHTNPGAAYEFTWKTDASGNVVPLKMETDQSVIINLDLDYTLDPVAKVLTAKANPAKQLRIPKSFYIDFVMAALGSQANTLIDIAVDFSIGIEPGTGNDQVYSFWSVTYHLTGSPAVTRMIIGQFTWDVNSTGSDGIRVMRPVGMSYPFTMYGSTTKLAPGNDNTVLTNYHAIFSNNIWSFTYKTGNEVRAAHTEILDFESEGKQNMEIAWFSSLRIATPGAAASPRVMFKRRNNGITEAYVNWSGGYAFNTQYSWVLCANPQWGWLAGVDAGYSGGAMNLMMPWNNIQIEYTPDTPPPADKLIMYGATYVEGNWSLFVNSAVTVVFSGHSTVAKQANWDLRDLTDVYRKQTFYIYCVSDGSVAFYEITKTLRGHSSAEILVGIVTTDDFGIVTIERRQSFTISGFPLTRARDMGVPVSSGSIVEEGTYKFISRSELYGN